MFFNKLSLYPGKLMDVSSSQRRQRTYLQQILQEKVRGGPVLNAKGQIVGINLGGF